MPRHRHIAAIEAGTSKIVVVIGEILPGREPRIIGFAQNASSGFSKGALVDLREAGDCIHRTLVEAVRDACVRLDRVFLSMTGNHIKGLRHEASVSIGTVDGTVSHEDIDAARRLAAARQLPKDRMVIEYLPGPFALDGRVVADPEHLAGRNLTTDCWTIHGDRDCTASLLRLIAGFRLRIGRLIFSGVASGEAITTGEQRQAGVLAIDMGAGCTDYVLYRHGCVRSAGTIAVGGDQFTNDLSLGLHLSLSDAEEIKKLHGRALVTCRDRVHRVWLHGAPRVGDRPIPLRAIETITAARMAELFGVVKRSIGPDCTPENIPAGVLLTGGAARLPAAKESAALVFAVDAHHGELPAWVDESLRRPELSTAMGLLIHGCGTPAHDPWRPRRRRSLLRRVFGDLFH